MRAEQDRITAGIIGDRLEAVACQMAIVLIRNARSYIVGESGDCSCAIFDFKGRCVAQSVQSPGHLLGIKLSVQAALKHFSGDLHDRDVIIVNDPYAGGTHLPAMTMMMPITCDGELFLFPAVRVRLSDIGGPHAGGMYPNAHELYQEGDIIPPVRLVEAGKLRRDIDIMERLLRNNRLPAIYRADLNAMMAANDCGRKGIAGLVYDYGAEKITAAIDRILDYTENMVRLEIKEWPDGKYEGCSCCDTDFRGSSDIKVNASVIIEGDRLKIDFTGSSPQVPGFINSPVANTMAYAIIPVLCAMKGTIPVNDGLFRAVEISAPRGSALDPSFPAPVGMCPFSLGAQISEAVARALAQVIPDKAGTGWANLPHVLIESQNTRDKRYFLYQAPLTAGGCGAGYGYDGWGWPGPFGRMRLPSIEMLEVQYPFTVEKRELVVDSAGAGKWRGSPGTAVTISATAPCRTTAFTQGVKWPADGFAGGSKGSPNAIKMQHGLSGERKAGTLFYRQDLAAGDRVYLEQGGGGGWGSPLERDPLLVKEDLTGEYISIEAAERDYGVIMNQPAFEIDYKLTAKRRKEIVKSKGG